MRVEIDVVFRFLDGDRKLTAKDAAIVERHVKNALAEALGKHNLRGLWVHEERPRGTRTKGKKRPKSPI